LKARVAIKLDAGKFVNARVTTAGLHRNGDYLMAKGLSASGL
jgi:hypothetical protein